MATRTTQVQKLAAILSIGIIRIVTDEEFTNAGLEKPPVTTYGFFPFNKDQYSTIWQTSLKDLINNAYFELN